MVRSITRKGALGAAAFRASTSRTVCCEPSAVAAVVRRIRSLSCSLSPAATSPSSHLQVGFSNGFILPIAFGLPRNFSFADLERAIVAHVPNRFLRDLFGPGSPYFLISCLCGLPVSIAIPKKSRAFAFGQAGIDLAVGFLQPFAFDKRFIDSRTEDRRIGLLHGGGKSFGFLNFASRQREAPIEVRRQVFATLREDPARSVCTSV